MKQRLQWLLGTLIVAGLVFAMGPRVQLDTTLRPAGLPAELAKLEEYIKQTESGFSDLRPHVAKKIVWANPKAHQQTPVSVVFLHGFSATRKEIDPLCLLLARAMKANLYYTRLRGHGRTGQAMAEGSVNLWLNDAYHALEVGRKLGKQVLLVGSSTGSTLALWLAAQPQVRDVLALILFSPNFHPKNKSARVLLWPWGLQLGILLGGKETRWKPRKPDQGKYWTTVYPMKAIVEMMGLVQLIKKTDLGRIKVPVQVIFSPKDRVVDSDLTRQRFPQLGSTHKELIALEQSEDIAHHILVGDILNPKNTPIVLQHILRFLKPVLPR